MNRSMATVESGMLDLIVRYAASNRLPLNVEGNALSSSGRVGVRAFHDCWKRTRDLSSDVDFGLHLAEFADSNQPKSDIIGSILSNSPNLRQAIIKLAKYHALSTDAVRVRLAVGSSEASLSWRSPAFQEIERDRHYCECILAGFAFMLRGLSDGKVSLLEARFAHAEPSLTSEHRRIFCCPLSFGSSKCELILARSYMDLPIPYADGRLLGLLETYASELLGAASVPRPISERTAKAVNVFLSKGIKPSLASVARDIAMSSRNLQLKLREEDTTYRILLDDLRKKISLECLAEPNASIGEIALLLGFEEQRAFTRAFRRWTGKSPKAFRKGFRSM